MVQFPRFRLAVPTDRDVERLTALRVTPFGHPRISGCLLLLAAFRSLPRPSSPSSSKASTVDPCPLCHITHLPFPVSDDRCKRPRRSAATSEARRRSRRPRASVKDPSSGRRANGKSARAPVDVHLESVWRPAGNARRVARRGGMGTRTPDLWLAKPSL